MNTLSRSGLLFLAILSVSAAGARADVVFSYTPTGAEYGGDQTPVKLDTSHASEGLISLPYAEMKWIGKDYRPVYSDETAYFTTLLRKIGFDPQMTKFTGQSKNKKYSEKWKSKVIEGAVSFYDSKTGLNIECRSEIIDSAPLQGFSALSPGGELYRALEGKKSIKVSLTNCGAPAVWDANHNRAVNQSTHDAKVEPQVESDIREATRHLSGGAH